MISTPNGTARRQGNSRIRDGIVRYHGLFREEESLKDQVPLNSIGIFPVIS